MPAEHHPGCQPAHPDGKNPEQTDRSPNARTGHSAGDLAYAGIHIGTPAGFDPRPIAGDHRVHAWRTIRTGRLHAGHPGHARDRNWKQSSPFRIHLQGPETLAALFNGHRPIRIADVWSDNPQAQFLRSLLDDGAAVLLEGMQSWMWVPLAVKGRIIGGVGVAHEKRNYFTAHHADLALSVANQAAITMVNAELYEHAQALAVLEERQRLARNLHDAVNQSLFSAGLIAEVLPRLWDRDQEEARRSLEDLRRLTRGAMAEMRALLAELRPSTLTDADLGDLLRLLGNAFTGRTNIPVNSDRGGGKASCPPRCRWHSTAYARKR